ncbi:MAG TPA: hypothetical protein ENK04_02190 [Gammaproteobacteria bacterium]|nr:hypothetical protein [Gammaproteobacteria bacterium]
MWLYWIERAQIVQEKCPQHAQILKIRPHLLKHTALPAIPDITTNVINPGKDNFLIFSHYISARARQTIFSITGPHCYAGKTVRHPLKTSSLKANPAATQGSLILIFSLHINTVYPHYFILL